MPLLGTGEGCLRRALCVDGSGRLVRSRSSTIDRVDDARRRDGELAIPIRHEGRVLEDGLLAAAARALEEDLRVRVVGHDGPAAGLDRERFATRLRSVVDEVRDLALRDAERL